MDQVIRAGKAILLGVAIGSVPASIIAYTWEWGINESNAAFFFFSILVSSIAWKELGRK